MQQESRQTEYSLGPFDPALPTPFKLTLGVEGEVIHSAAITRGYVHRGIEKALEQHPWSAVFPYVDRLDPECAFFAEAVVCAAVENIAQMRVSERTATVRKLLCELNRVSSHLLFMAKMARAVQSPSLVHYVLRDREKLLDLFELLTGARFYPNYFRFGGLAADVTEGFLERVVEVSETLAERFREYDDILLKNESFVRRLRGVGVLSKEVSESLGVTGPNATALSEGHEGDALSRVKIRLQEMKTASQWARECAERVPAGAVSLRQPNEEFVVPSGEGYARIDGPRGLLACHVVSDGAVHPCRIQFRSPSVSHLAAAEKILVGARLQDIPVILCSLDLSTTEADR